MIKQNNECPGYYEVSGYTTKDGKKVDSYIRNCWKHGDSTSNIGVKNTQERIEKTIKIIENILKQKTVTDEDIAKINNQNQMTIHNLFDDLEDLSVQKSNLPKIPTIESAEENIKIENNKKQLRDNAYQTILMLSLSKQALDKNWKKLHIKGSNDEMYEYINKKKDIEKLDDAVENILKETSNINEKTLNNVQKLKEEMGLMRFKQMPSQQNKTQEQKWIWPVESKNITSFYGKRVHPITKKETFHTGIDIKVKEGTPVRAIADGKVFVVSTKMQGYGTGVFIDHGKVEGKYVKSEYGHLSRYCVKYGQYVKQGEIIGYSGNTGDSTGDHLHLTIRISSDNVKFIHDNPLKYLEKY